MKTSAVLLLLLTLVCTGCDPAWSITDPIYAMVSLRDLPVGYVIKESDVKTMQIGISHREMLHPFRPRPSDEFTTDASKIVGHTVKTFIPAHRAISPQRDLI